MTKLEIRPFSEELLEEAAALLAARHRAQRAVEPRLPARYEDVHAAALEITALATAEGVSGAVALRGGRVTGYLLGAPRDEASWGENAWVELAGHAAVDAEQIRDLYAFAAAEWVERGLVDHYALVPACDASRAQRCSAGPRIVADWRVTNLLASRFWPRRGFRETFLRLHRRIRPPE